MLFFPILLVALHNVQWLATKDLRNICLERSRSDDLAKRNRIYPDPNNPYGYIFCDNERHPVHLTCPVGLAYDDKTQSCILNRKTDKECERCVHGKCVNGTCECNIGYEGRSCDIKIDICAKEGYDKCGASGICKNGVGTHVCLCSNGKIGYDCENAIENPCKSDSIVSNRTKFVFGPQGRYLQCIEPYTFTVHKCLKNQEFDEITGKCVDIQNSCANTQCQNNGYCIEDENRNARCLCKPGFQGELCEYKIDFCENSPCGDGKCENGIFGPICSCPNKLTDESCYSEIDNPCGTHDYGKVYEVISDVHQNTFIYCHFNGHGIVIKCPASTIFNKDHLICETEFSRYLRRKSNSLQSLAKDQLNIEKSKDIHETFSSQRPSYKQSSNDYNIITITGIDKNVYNKPAQKDVSINENKQYTQALVNEEKDDRKSMYKHLQLVDPNTAVYFANKGLSPEIATQASKVLQATVFQVNNAKQNPIQKEYERKESAGTTSAKIKNQKINFKLLNDESQRGRRSLDWMDPESAIEKYGSSIITDPSRINNAISSFGNSDAYESPRTETDFIANNYNPSFTNYDPEMMSHYSAKPSFDRIRLQDSLMNDANLDEEFLKNLRQFRDSPGLKESEFPYNQLQGEDGTYPNMKQNLNYDMSYPKEFSYRKPFESFQYDYQPDSFNMNPYQPSLETPKQFGQDETFPNLNEDRNFDTSDIRSPLDETNDNYQRYGEHQSEDDGPNEMHDNIFKRATKKKATRKN